MARAGSPCGPCANRSRPAQRCRRSTWTHSAPTPQPRPSTDRSSRTSAHHGVDVFGHLESATVVARSSISDACARERLAILEPRHHHRHRRPRIDRRAQHLNIGPEHLELAIATAVPRGRSGIGIELVDVVGARLVIRERLLSLGDARQPGALSFSPRRPPISSSSSTSLMSSVISEGLPPRPAIWQPRRDPNLSREDWSLPTSNPHSARPRLRRRRRHELAARRHARLQGSAFGAWMRQFTANSPNASAPWLFSS